MLSDAFEVKLVDLVNGTRLWPWVFEFVDRIVVVNEVISLQVVDEVINGVVVLGCEDGVTVGYGQ